MLYIWVRRTTEWAHEREFLAQLPTEMKPAVELWDRTFEMPFHLFRHRVREIARLNLSRVENAAHADWEQIPEGALVAPVDDDDWFAPDLAATLEAELGPRTSGCFWISSWVEVPINFGHRLYMLRHAILPRMAPAWICTTNNYALPKGPDTKRLLGSHMSASEWFTERPGEVKRIERRLSVANRSLASRTSLLPRGRPIGRAHLIRKLGRYRSLYREPKTIEPAWCRPYVAMMAELMGELGPRAG